MSGQGQWAVELDAFGKSYAGGWTGGRRWAVRDVTLKLRHGEILGILGPNGSGKSTTLRALAGLVRPSAGNCRLMGHAAGSPEARAVMGYLPDLVRFPRGQSAREILWFLARLSGLSEVEAERRIQGALAWSGLESVENAKVETFSKGMRQRLGLAQATLHEPAVFLLDEPTSGLDPLGRMELARLVRRLADEGRTVVMTSHLLAQAEAVCDRVALLGHGRLLWEGDPAALENGRGAPVSEVSALEKLYLEKCHGR